MKGVRHERWKIADLVSDAANPRTIAKAKREALAGSLEMFGQVQEIVVNARTKKIVGGHQRISLLIERGETEVDVAVGDWTDEEARILNVILNSPEAQGEFTNPGAYLENALRTLSLRDFKRLRLDALVLEPSKKEAKRRDAKALEYKLVVTARDEHHQAELLERFETDGLEVKLLIV